MPIFDRSAEMIMSQIGENMGKELTIRTLTPGGSVFAAIGVYAKIKEHGNVRLKIDGAAMSAGAFLPLYAKHTSCFDVTRFVFHRADMFVANPDDQKFLDDLNKDLKALMEKKINAAVWKQITKTSIEDLFDPTKRIDVTVTGNEAKLIGLVDEVKELTPQALKEISAFSNKYFDVAAESGSSSTENKPKPMTKQELQAAHPAVYAEIYAEGKAAGSAEMKQTAEAWAHFAGVDPKAVSDGIKSGVAMTQLQMIELTHKQMNPTSKKKEDLESDNAKEVKTDGKKDPEQTENEKFVAEAKKHSQYFNEKA